ncbi:uncharacterized protein LOC107621492 isoform X1 [Arachis ipaensis]|uniref:uncharacterized protein LOC107621492 isoform X1 n=1 Tax=Arachis ipaensis TaxID=130454 RepID=UPI000A2B948F|nr:uncharacterized protein LOC107621492 isoform X1 [Arachis ipaensis]QHN83409.1 Putative ribonuclease H protein [Arachis hypogaea]
MYYLNLFKMPKAVVTKITSLQSRFFWGKSDGTKGMSIVSWSLIQKPKSQGGLGVRDLVLKNAALLFKWWWRFDKEECPLWKRVVCSCNKLDSKKGLEKQQMKNTRSLWNTIGNLRFSEAELFSIFYEGMQLQLGDGTRTLFWNNVWMKDGRLRDRFPNLYRVAVDKACTISDCSFWDGYVWRWGLQWRRALWLWEEQELSELQTGLTKVGIRQSEVDKLIWKHDKEGNFSVKSFLNVLYKNKNLGQEPNMFNFYNNLWRSLVPPRVEIFVWFVILERVNTKDKLVRCGILPTSEITCVICGKAPESVHHLFFTCEYAWKLWGSALRFWNILWVWAGDPRQCFESWIHGANRKGEKEDWMTTFFCCNLVSVET